MLNESDLIDTVNEFSSYIYLFNLPKRIYDMYIEF